MARHGWKTRPSPRRGFTVVEASREQIGSPVVVALHDSFQSIRLFRCAVEEAMNRFRNLVVLDYGEVPLQEELDDDSFDIDPRERTSVRALWSNPHVRVVRIEPMESDLEKTVAYCESTKACLLVLAADHVGSSRLDAALADRIFRGAFDVLVLAGPG